MGEFEEAVEFIFVEEAARGDRLTGNIIEYFPRAEVACYQNEERTRIAASGVYRSSRTLFLQRHRGRFIKPFPSHPWYQGGESVNLILGFNCFASCHYCFVHSYFDDRFPTLFTNTDDMDDELRAFLRANPGAWVSTGEFLDSLQLDHATRQTERILYIFREFPDAVIELRTKHSRVEHIPENFIPGAQISFSINPPSIARLVESGSADLTRRLLAARHLHDKGYRITFRIDPILATEEYLDAYGALGEAVEQAFGWERAAGVFLGVLRFDTDLLRRFARGTAALKLLDAEYTLGPDGKHRLYKQARIVVYRELAAQIRRFNKKIKISLVMEPDYVCRAVLGPE